MRCRPCLTAKKTEDDKEFDDFINGIANNARRLQQGNYYYPSNTRSKKSTTSMINEQPTLLRPLKRTPIPVNDTFISRPLKDRPPSYTITIDVKDDIQFQVLNNILQSSEWNEEKRRQVKELEKSIKYNQQAIKDMQLVIQGLVKKHKNNRSYISSLTKIALDMSIGIPGSVVASAIYDTLKRK